MTSARAAFSLPEDDDEGYDTPRNDSHSTSSSTSTSSMTDGSGALGRLQQKLTAAIEHMECAQLEFFHVNRAFEARKKHEQQQQQRRRQYDQRQQYAQQQGPLPWSVKVQLYCEFWQQFVNQLREALLQGDRGKDPEPASSSNEQSLKALSLLASNVWGETRASPQEIFKYGPIVLSPQQGVQHQPKLKSKLKLKPKPKKSDALLSAFPEQRAMPMPAVPTVFNGIGPHLEVSSWVATGTKTNADLGAATTSDGKEMAASSSSMNGGPRKKSKTVKTKASAPVNSVANGPEAVKRKTLSASNGSAALTGTAPFGTAAIASGAKPAAASDESAVERRLATAPCRRSGFGRVLGRPPPGRGHPRASSEPEASAPQPASSSATTNGSASATTIASPPRKKKITARLVDRKCVLASTADEPERVCADADDGELDGDQAELQMIPVESATSENTVRIKEEVVAGSHDSVTTTPTTKLSATARRVRDRYLLYAQLRHRIQGQLEANEVWLDLSIPFPTHLLIFEPKEHPQLADTHGKFWESSIGRYLEMVFYHSPAGEKNRAGLSKMRLLRRQREVLSEYIETLGVCKVAQKLYERPEASFAFFFNKKMIRLELLTSEELDVHLLYLKEPWKSPTTQANQVSWWETLYTTAAGKPPAIQMSEAAKQQIARAHFRGELDFDENWLRFANESPWKEMLEELRVVVTAPAITPATTNDSKKVDGGGDEHDFPQSPPRRKKIAGKVPMNRERTLKASGTSNEAAERLRRLQQRLSDRAESSSSTSTDDDADDNDFIEQAGGRRIKLGKRLRTSK